MQSEAANVQTTVSTSNPHSQPLQVNQAHQSSPPEPINNNPSHGDLDREIFKAQEGETPLEFVKRLTAGEAPKQNTEEPLIKVPTVSSQQQPADPTPAKLPDKDPEVTFDDPKDKTETEDADKKADGEVTPEEAEDDIEVPDSPVAENFKKLRTKLKETKTQFSEAIKQKEELEKKVRQYETGEVLPEVVAEKEKEIQRLTKYEKLVNLKGSKEYQEKYVNPIKTVRENLKTKFAEYNVPEALIDKALTAKNGPELDQFLEENFSIVTALEVKNLITQAKTIQASAQAAEAEPEQMLSNWAKESEAIAQQQALETKVRIQGSAKDNWTKALIDIRNEGKLHEVIRKPHDPEFNAKYVDPILDRAAKDYGRLVTELAGVGLKELPEHIGKTLAIGVIKAIAAEIAVHERDAAVGYIDKITQNQRTMNAINRPALGGGSRSAPSGPPAAPAKTETTPEQDAMNLINSVLNRK